MADYRSIPVENSRYVPSMVQVYSEPIESCTPGNVQVLVVSLFLFSDRFPGQSVLSEDLNGETSPAYNLVPSRICLHLESLIVLPLARSSPGTNNEWRYSG